ncbi:S-formylglutathione hydrolase FrmB [Lipingzhangella halophila]|uniref:S-formylglutathione hydrolase FrmB n=1 Tax=Lipingzhangella halophila TaxID=1783352 RepID=A0A7W7RKM3_9ACTN|nr:alpha/beta hydrolase family protein [Lipingzhangella halophila]MBB4933695.1 S-formylglutathione hydrolase FrmB [Lipingzhangella halophila]
MTDEEWLDERTVDVTIDSPAMGTGQPVRLIVPPGWDTETDAARTWPVLYLLHGGRDDYTSWTRETDVAELSARNQVIIAMPEGGRAGNYSDWYNYGRGGAPRWETFHLEEVWQVLRDRYGAGERRAVAGISSGGYGAVIYAARNPGMFTAAASYSGLLTPRTELSWTLLKAVMRNEGLDPYAMWGFPGLHEDVWRAHDPVAQAEGLRGTDLYLSSGTTGRPGDLDGDQGYGNSLGLGEAMCGSSLQTMRRVLDLHDIPATVHLYRRGTHSWPYWQRELHTSWPMLMDSLGAEDTHPEQA